MAWPCGVRACQSLLKPIVSKLAAKSSVMNADASAGFALSPRQANQRSMSVLRMINRDKQRLRRSANFDSLPKPKKKCFLRMFWHVVQLHCLSSLLLLLPHCLHPCFQPRLYSFCLIYYSYIRPFYCHRCCACSVSLKCMCPVEEVSVTGVTIRRSSCFWNQTMKKS